MAPSDKSWRTSTEASIVTSVVDNELTGTVPFHQSTRCKFIGSILGDGQQFQNVTMPLMFEHRTKSNTSVRINKPFLVATNESYADLCEDVKHFFHLRRLPVLRVDWAPGSGMGEPTKINDQNLVILLRLLRARGSMDKIIIEYSGDLVATKSESSGHTAIDEAKEEA